jgi:hypothetical protein
MWTGFAWSDSRVKISVSGRPVFNGAQWTPPSALTKMPLPNVAAKTTFALFGLCRMLRTEFSVAIFESSVQEVPLFELR